MDPLSIRRHLLAGLAGLALAAAAAPASAADAYPTRPVRLVVPFGAGGNADLVARVIAPPLSEALGQTVVIENRPGAGGTLGAAAVAQAPADGYTLLFAATGPNAVAPAIYANLPYDPATSFTAVSRISIQPSVVVVNPRLGASDLPGFIALARAKPGSIDFGSPGIGSTSHLAGELFQSMAGVRLVHVPYKEAGQALADLAEGRIGVMFDNVGVFLSHIQAGRLRPLAVSGEQRTDLLPGVPTTAEAGLPGYAYQIWFGLSAPVRTPPDVVARLHRDVTTVLARPDVAAGLARLNAEISPAGPEAFQAFVTSEIGRWSRTAQAAGIKPGGDR